MKNTKKRYRLIACEVMFREICLCAADCPNIIDIAFMGQGYHDMGETIMREKLQEEIDRTEIEKYDAILLGYGLCSNGTKGLHADIPIVIPRAHDCITLLMGSKEAYNEYFYANPGTFFLSSGWIERDVGATEGGIAQTLQLGRDKSYYAASYGEENAEYLAEMLGNTLGNYQKLAFIDTGTGAVSEDRKYACETAEIRNWEFEEMPGDLSLLRELLDGHWDEDRFLLVHPGCTIAQSNDAAVLRAAAGNEEDQ